VQRALALVVLGAVTLAGAAAVTLPWLSYTYRKAGARIWVSDPGTAYDRLELAARLDPLGADAYIVEGSIALRRRDLERAREALDRALDREPDNWYPYLQLGLLAGFRGDYQEAERQVRRAAELNPLDPGVVLATQLIDGGAEIDPELVNSVYLPEPDERGNLNE
jgi:tetratricopeptide (TPR) repeat protein